MGGFLVARSYQGNEKFCHHQEIPMCEDGFNGIADIGWDGGFLSWTPSRFRDGKISLDITGL
jgi:hypothetical protein